jgi:phage terminase large subunit-like protein
LDNDRKPAEAAEANSTSTPRGPKSVRDLLGSLPIGEWDAFLDELSANALLSLPWLFEHWALEGHQLPPAGDWTTWVILGGRGAGKTRAGSEWVRAQVEGSRPGDRGQCSRVALVGETIDQAREVMVFGESGIMASSPPDRRPEWQASRKRLVWPNGAVAQVFAAHEPEALRGPQFDCAWADELAKWKKGEAAWDMLQFGLRLGERPRQVVTTTPRGVPLLQAILADPATVVTHAATQANRMNLARSFLEHVEAKYGGTRLGRQELDGEMLFDVEGALWTAASLAAARAPRAVELDRIVVAVDPPVSAGSDADECGIVVVGAATKGPPQDWVAVVLEDGSLSGASPQAWAEAAVALYHKHGADRLVAEVNQGGDLVRTLVQGVAPTVPFKAVRAAPRQGGARRAGGGALRAGAGEPCHGVPAARGPDAGDDGARLRRAGLARPGGRAGLGADGADRRAGGAVPGAAAAGALTLLFERSRTGTRGVSSRRD